jgi:hypothetical protein
MQGLDSLPKRDAAFVQPMECLAVRRLPDGVDWAYEIKLDGYRAVGIRLKHLIREHPLKAQQILDLAVEIAGGRRDAKGCRG